MYNKFYIEIAKYINDNKTINEICDNLDISRKQLYYYLQCLKNDGINFSRKYYENGQIVYTPVKSIRDMKEINNINNDNIPLITEKGKNYTRFLVISDLHFGNSNENIENINRAYNYCVKNDINVILVCGDLIDGTYTRNIKRRPDEEVYTQIEHLIKDYPFDKNIINICVLGDHDKSALYESKIDLSMVLKNKRHDIVATNYGNTYVNIKNDKILLHHPLQDSKGVNNDATIILKGHSHEYNCSSSNNMLKITVPTLSNIIMSDTIPSCLDLYVNYKKGIIDYVEVKQVVFLEKDITLSVNKFNLNRESKNIDKIENEEDFDKFTKNDMDIFDNLLIDDIDDDRKVKIR